MCQNVSVDVPYDHLLRVFHCVDNVYYNYTVSGHTYTLYCCIVMDEPLRVQFPTQSNYRRFQTLPQPSETSRINLLPLTSTEK